MFCKMCVTVALCLVFLLTFSEGFFIPMSFRKQAPQTTYNSPHWIATQTTGSSNGANTIPAGYGNPKDYNNYQQQQQPQSLQPQQQSQQQQQQQQHQQTPLQSQTAYSSQLYNVQPTAPKYESVPYQSLNQPLYSYDGVYPAPLNSYSQSVQLVPCLCPLNKEIIEQQNQQLQQQSSLPIAPTSSSFSTETNNNNNNNNNNAAPSAPQPNQKKAS